MQVSYFKISHDEFADIRELMVTEVWIREDRNTHQFTIMHTDGDFLEQVLEDHDIRTQVLIGDFKELSAQ